MSTPVVPVTPADRGQQLRTWAFIVVPSFISLLCMIWVLQGAGLQHIWFEIRHMNWRWVALAVVADVCVYLLHGWRWQLLLAPVQPIRYAHSVEAIYVGLFANEVLPLRAGELIRCFLLAKSAELPLSVSFASALIERIFDGIWLMACFLYCLHMGKLPNVLLKGGYILGIIIAVSMAVLGYAMYAKKQSIDLIFGMAWPRWLNTLIEDLHLIGHSRFLYYSFGVSGLYMLGQMAPIYLLVMANKLAVPWTASFTMLVLLRLSSIVPQAPGNLGSFNWVAAQTLVMFGLARDHAKRFSLILWAVLTLPLVVIGFVALAREGVNMSHLHKEATAAASTKRSRSNV